MCCPIQFHFTAVYRESLSFSFVTNGSGTCHRPSRRSHGMCAGDGDTSVSFFLGSFVSFVSPINSGNLGVFLFASILILHLSHELIENSLGPCEHLHRCRKSETTMCCPVFSSHLIQHQTRVFSQTLILWTYQKELSHEILSLLDSLAQSHGLCSLGRTHSTEMAARTFANPVSAPWRLPIFEPKNDSWMISFVVLTPNPMTASYLTGSDVSLCN